MAMAGLSRRFKANQHALLWILCQNVDEQHMFRMKPNTAKMYHLLKSLTQTYVGIYCIIQCIYHYPTLTLRLRYAETTACASCARTV